MNETQTRQADQRAHLTLQTQELRRNLQTPIQAPRIALERKISLRFPHFQGFLTEYSSNISITGMFVCSQKPRPSGTVLDFEFNLIDGLKLIHGTGEVMWVRSDDAGPDLPAGMGIRFLRLDAESRRLIRWAVEKQIYDGVEPFDLESYRTEALATVDQAAARSAVAKPAAARSTVGTATAGVDASKLYPYAGYAKAKRPSKKLLAAAFGLLPFAALAVVLYLTYPGSHPPAVAEARATSPAATEPIETLGEPSAIQTVIEEPEDLVEPVIRGTEAWARAWAEQRPEDYIRFYSPSFDPPRDLDRAGWENLRRSRISGPKFIQVAISGLDAELLDPDHARVSFDQSYRSDNFHDAMRKTLEWVREDGEWKILAEHAASG